MHDMPPSLRSAQRSPASREMKRLLLILVGAVVVLDAAVIGLYYAARIQERPIKQQQLFVAVWVVLTLTVVATMMKRIRQARRRR
jgi:NADH:ubiquinone oxidoreductase subunit 6 (subunit J)